MTKPLTVIAIAAALLWTATAGAQSRITIDGYQERVPGANAELRCDGVRLSRTMQIDSISGYHNGFWISKSGRIEKAYWTLRHSDSCIGYELKPGFYHVYPNIVLPADTAHITLWLSEKR
jgi:hypothetical protein